MIPGSNLLKAALTIIAPQTVSYYRYLSRSVNNIGLEVSVYDDPIDIKGSFQPVPMNLYEQYGLDLSRSYVIFYSANDIISTMRDTSGDQIIAYGKKYQCESNNDWHNVDGWKGVLMVMIPN